MIDSELLYHLRSAVRSPAYTGLIESVLPTLIDCVADIGSTLKSSHYVSQAGSANAFGDDQLNVDVLAEKSIRTAISRCAFVITASSEEDPVERVVQHQQESVAKNVSEEQYTIAFDPLDGSSIIASNWTVGTIIGVWKGKTALGQPPASSQVASLLGVYGPRTTVIIALRAPGSEPICLEIGIGEGGVRGCEIIRPTIRLAESPFKTRYFAPANLRAAADNEKYMSLVSHFIQNKYTLRYSGGLVPDVVHALVKGHGVYISPVTAASKAKLRRLYELFPLALIIECAGGKAIDPADGTDILDKELTDLNETAGLVCGTADEVDFVKKALLD
ncbi:sedoheptulose-1,7-bisphosphatase [Annulohypoxylon maeteangense]|uniref:sedoheptulose-1,7-bisphosphatase n=1 Tax=Annulohypoxylon maeteangense TaxID=1927788 RepID=UPI0020082B06|nr:sedoheptulose-1,7-bisphosphatase [Annulohypoxylon maeteangense]KAI0884029.1 sedoheptulose-1,7-bisphosphatase [Annulohypoxylon maeteangense]